MRQWLIRCGKKVDDALYYTSREEDLYCGVMTGLTGFWLITKDLKNLMGDSTIPEPRGLYWLHVFSSVVAPYLPYVIGMFLCLTGYRLIRWNWEEEVEEESEVTRDADVV